MDDSRRSRSGHSRSERSRSDHSRQASEHSERNTSEHSRSKQHEETFNPVTNVEFAEESEAGETSQMPPSILRNKDKKSSVSFRDVWKGSSHSTEDHTGGQDIPGYSEHTSSKGEGTDGGDHTDNFLIDPSESTYGGYVHKVRPENPEEPLPVQRSLPRDLFNKRNIILLSLVLATVILAIVLPVVLISNKSDDNGSTGEVIDTSGIAVACAGQPNSCTFVANMLVSVHPLRTWSQINLKGSCQNQALLWLTKLTGVEWLSARQIRDRYALGVTTCELIEDWQTAIVEGTPSEPCFNVADSGASQFNLNCGYENIVLDGSQQRLLGTLAPELSMATDLKTVEIRNSVKAINTGARRMQQTTSTGISGQIPEEYSILTKMETLDLSNNRLTGEIPPSIVNPVMRELILDRNSLTGGFSVDPQQGASLEVVSLSGNSINTASGLNELCDANDDEGISIIIELDCSCCIAMLTPTTAPTDSPIQIPSTTKTPNVDSSTTSAPTLSPLMTPIFSGSPTLSPNISSTTSPVAVPVATEAPIASTASPVSSTASPTMLPTTAAPSRVPQKPSEPCQLDSNCVFVMNALLAEHPAQTASRLNTEGTCQNFAREHLRNTPNVTTLGTGEVRQRYTLVFLYCHWDGDSWPEEIKAPWLKDTNECQWLPAIDGKACNSRNKLRILRLNGLQIQGTIPPEIILLKFLVELSLSDNLITGTIPDEVSKSVSLTLLDLSRNRIRGQIPPSLWETRRLSLLDLSSNSLTGTVPASVGSATALTSLNLSFNDLWRLIPSEIGGLINLKELKLEENRFSGTIPGNLGSLASLTHLDLSGNLLMGTFPEALTAITNLESLALAGSGLTGQIPPSIRNFFALKHLTLANNRFSGALPTEIGALSSLQTALFNANRLSGRIPTECGALIALERFSLEDNLLTGTMPNQVCSLSNITSLVVDCAVECSCCTSCKGA